MSSCPNARRGDRFGDLQDPGGENRVTGEIESQVTVLVAEMGHRLLYDGAGKITS